MFMPKFKFIAVMVPEIQAFKNENSEIARKCPFSQTLSHMYMYITNFCQEKILPSTLVDCVKNVVR